MRDATRSKNRVVCRLMTNTHDPKTLPDDELLRRLSDLVQRSRRVEAVLVAHIAEVDDRRLYIRHAPSMFAFCTQVLHLSEHEAYARITVARAARRRPVLLAMLSDGRLHLSGVAKLVPHLTDVNETELLARATHRSKSEIEALLAEIAPKPDAVPAIRRVREPRDVVGSAELGPDRVGGAREIPLLLASAPTVGASTRALDEPVATRAERVSPAARLSCAVTRLIQGSVHRISHAPRQAGAATGTSSRRSGHGHRDGGDREASAARGEAVRSNARFPTNVGRF